LGDATPSYSFANTPLKAAHAPLEMASISQADFVCGRDMVVVGVLGCNGRKPMLQSRLIDDLQADALPSLVI